MPASADWRTPPDIVGRARHVLGGVIDLDPASDAEAQKTVRATRYLTKEDDAFNTAWFPRESQKPGSVFLNPPGGKVAGVSQAAMFWTSLLYEWEQNRVSHAIFIGFNLEILRASQRNGPADYPKMLHMPFCVPRSRIRFIDPATGLPGSWPVHANVIVYVPGTIDRREVFAETFGPLGAVRL